MKTEGSYGGQEPKNLINSRKSVFVRGSRDVHYSMSPSPIVKGQQKSGNTTNKSFNIKSGANNNQQSVDKPKGFGNNKHMIARSHTLHRSDGFQLKDGKNLQDDKFVDKMTYSDVIKMFDNINSEIDLTLKKEENSKKNNFRAYHTSYGGFRRNSTPKSQQNQDFDNKSVSKFIPQEEADNPATNNRPSVGNQNNGNNKNKNFFAKLPNKSKHPLKNTKKFLDFKDDKHKTGLNVNF